MVDKLLEEPKSSTSIDNNTIFEENLPTTTVGNRQASLYTKISLRYYV